MTVDQSLAGILLGGEPELFLAEQLDDGYAYYRFRCPCCGQTHHFGAPLEPGLLDSPYGPCPATFRQEQTESGAWQLTMATRPARERAEA